MNGIPYFHAAYAVVWVVLSGYSVRIGMMRFSLRKELAEINGHETSMLPSGPEG
jgi:CcmD family protein